MYPIQPNASTIWRWEFSCQANGHGCGTRLYAGVDKVEKSASGGYYVDCPACGARNWVPKGLITKLFLEQFGKRR